MVKTGKVNDRPYGRLSVVLVVSDHINDYKARIQRGTYKYTYRARVKKLR